MNLRRVDNSSTFLPETSKVLRNLSSRSKMIYYSGLPTRDSSSIYLNLTYFLQPGRPTGAKIKRGMKLNNYFRKILNVFP